MDKQERSFILGRAILVASNGSLGFLVLITGIITSYATNPVFDITGTAEVILGLLFCINAYYIQGVLYFKD